MSKKQDAANVFMAMNNMAPARDAAGVIIQPGDWVIRAVDVTTSATLSIARAFPKQKLSEAEATYSRQTKELGKPSVTTYSANMDISNWPCNDEGLPMRPQSKRLDKQFADNPHYNGTMHALISAGNVAGDIGAARMFIIPKALVPPPIRRLLAGTLKDIKQRATLLNKRNKDALRAWQLHRAQPPGDK